MGPKGQGMRSSARLSPAEGLKPDALGVQAFCRNCFWPTHLPTNFLRQGLINLSTHLKNVVMGDSGSWKVTPGKTRVHTWIWMTSALQEIVRRISFDDDDSQCIQDLDSNLPFSFHGMAMV